jgi:hypothetical protein
VTLTFNLLLLAATETPAPETGPATELAHHLTEHFTTPATPRYGGRDLGTPNRLVLLLDHEYTQRGLNWRRLKGADAERAALVRAAAEQARCDAVSLMAADCLTLGQDHDAVLVVLGVDEHRYVRFAQQARARLDDHVPLRSQFTLTATYTRMVRGFGGHPKFSKNIPGSLDVTAPPEEVHRLLAAEPPIPEESATYQLMCQVPRYDAGTRLNLHAAREVVHVQLADHGRAVVEQARDDGCVDIRDGDRAGPLHPQRPPPMSRDTIIIGPGASERSSVLTSWVGAP